MRDLLRCEKSNRSTAARSTILVSTAIDDADEPKNAPELPIGRFLKSTSTRGNRVIFGRSPTGIRMTENPYSTPSLDASSESWDSLTSSTASQSLASIAKPTFLAWERLRLIFVVVLGLLTLLLAGPSLTKLRTLVLIAEGAIVANVCFFAGPIIETYVRWLGYDRRWVRWFLFVGGTMLTAMLAVATMASVLLPDQD